MVAEPHSSAAEIEAWQRAEKQRIAAQYPDEDEDFAETILATPWRDSLEADVRAAYEAHMTWAVAERANGFYTFPSDDLFWMNVALLLPDYEPYLNKAKRETPAGREFMKRVKRIYPDAADTFERSDAPLGS